MDSLRTPLFIIAAFLILVAVLVELGSTSLIPVSTVATTAASQPPASLVEGLSASDTADFASRIQSTPKAPGLAIRDMALVDAVALFAVILMGMALLLPERVTGRTQGILTLCFSIFVILAGIVLLVAAFTKLMIMVGLFLAAPFGTLAYLAAFGSFNRGGAQATLGMLMVLKLAFAALLVLAHQRFLQNKGLVLIILTSLAGNLVIGFLQNLVPGILVSITDSVAAIVVVVFALIWAVFLLVGSVISMVKAVV
jgi:hypothetical protein